MALDKDDQVIGYKFVHLGKMMEAIRGGMDPREAYEKNIGTYGRYDDSRKIHRPEEAIRRFRHGTV